MARHGATLIGRGKDADATAWKTAVLANGGTVSDGTLAAVDAFCVAAKANGYWAKLQRINLFCGGQLAAALVPLKIGGGNATDTNNGFVSGDYGEATGLQGNGAKYLDTGIAVNVVGGGAGDNHMAAYAASMESTGGSNFSVMGAYGASPFPGITLSFITGGNRRYYADNSFSAGGQASAGAVTAVTGAFVHGSQTGLTATALYQNGSSIATSANTTAAISHTGNVYVFRVNNAAPEATSATVRAYSLGNGMSSTDAANYYADMQAFQTALGRQV